jgi:perosamine synthetase
MKVPLVKVKLNEADRESILSVTYPDESGATWLSQGPKVKEFEAAVAEYLGVPPERVVACSSGTAALHLAIEALGLPKGSRIACPSLTFIATANAINMAGHKPMFQEVDENCVLRWEKASPPPQAWVPVHHFGTANRWATDLANDALIVHDACPSFGAEWEGKKLGSWQHSTCFSLHALKVLTAGEGGIYVGKNHAKVRLLRCHGMTKSPFDRHSEEAKDTVRFERYECLGYNYRMPELTAALALSQLKRIDAIIARRREVAGIYDTEFAGKCRIIGVVDRDRSSAQSYVLELGSAEKRNRAIRELASRGVQAKRGLMACHLEPAYDLAGSLPMTESLAGRTLRIPIFEMSEEEVGIVVDAVKEVL